MGRGQWRNSLHLRCQKPYRRFGKLSYPQKETKKALLTTEVHLGFPSGVTQGVKVTPLFPANTNRNGDKRVFYLIVVRSSDYRSCTFLPSLSSLVQKKKVGTFPVPPMRQADQYLSFTTCQRPPEMPYKFRGQKDLLSLP
ncbi:hypothetical protein AVEN_111905-1 [Araneus ventricosus]|uniref:Uncharacterized protein n=1 Tax=Araneus ventricosus TaxID=182803 RepID=A0A4Y2JEB4_ARAVE|nr:hypothetical protein AVEN_111905-1 [Araneus ventricosus]